jgi:hypothetical protein
MTYIAVVFPVEEKQKLLTEFWKLNLSVQGQWKFYAHHMTVNMGMEEPGLSLLEKEAEVTVHSYSFNELVIAFAVDCDMPSHNNVKHITIAVNESLGGKPKYSKDLVQWFPLETPFKVKGTVKVC